MYSIYISIWIFVIRLFGLVLYKLLQCGDSIGDDAYYTLFDWKTNMGSVVLIKMDKSSSYRKLIELCLTTTITTHIVTAMIQSICIHEINPVVFPHNPTDIETALEEKSIAKLCLIPCRCTVKCVVIYICILQQL